MDDKVVTTWMAQQCRRLGDRIAHADLFKKACQIIKRFRGHTSRTLVVKWVKAHNQVTGNEIADGLAKAGARLRQQLAN